MSVNKTKKLVFTDLTFQGERESTKVQSVLEDKKYF